MSVDWTINLPLLFTIVATIAAIAWNRSTDIKLLGKDISQLDKAVTSIQKEIEVLNKAIVGQIVQDNRISELERRLSEYQSGREKFRTATSERLADISQAIAILHKDQSDLKVEVSKKA